RNARPRYGHLGGRARGADLREHLRGRLAALGRADEDDSERVPSHAVAEGSAGARQEAHGGFLLRRRSGAPTRIRPAAGEIRRLAAGGWRFVLTIRRSARASRYRT